MRREFRVVFALLLSRTTAFAGRRRVFRREEAIELLRGVLVKVNDADIESVLAPIIDQAQAAYGDVTLVERPNVVDPLLDMRLALIG